jgi:thiamine biosynthesis lipoprotein
VVVHEWTYSVLQTSSELQRQSKGLFNIAVAPTLERLGLLPQSVERSRPLADLGQEGAVELFAGNRARLRAPGSKIDLGGIAKGFAVDQAIGVLREHGVRSGLVNAGGDLAGFGPHEHVIAIRDPREPARLLARTALRDAALASSGLDFGFFGRSQHCSIIDPRAKQPVTAISGASVRAASCTTADALTKVVMLAGTAASDVLDGYGASALFVTKTGEVLATADWQDVHSLAA